MRTVALFGAGQVGAIVSRLLGPGYGVCCFADNDEAKWGSTLAGIPVLSPEESLINDPDCFCLCVLEAKEAEVTYSMVRIAPLLTEIFESAEPIAAEYQVTLHKECEPLTIEASAKQLRELIMNLVSNGIKYNHPGGNVWVEISSEGPDMCIRVRDDGCGISKEEQERVFERFYRVDKGRSKKMGGTGLGLSIVKHIVEFYGGHIELTSTPGKGSCFTVTIPFSAQNKAKS